MNFLQAFMELENYRQALKLYMYIKFLFFTPLLLIQRLTQRNSVITCFVRLVFLSAPGQLLVKSY